MKALVKNKSREELKKILMDKSVDFLNYEHEHLFQDTNNLNGEYVEGFYIEIEDILDILLGVSQE